MKKLCVKALRVLEIDEVSFDVDGVKRVGHRISAVFHEGDFEAANECVEAGPRLPGGAIAADICWVAVAGVAAGGGVDFCLAESVEVAEEFHDILSAAASEA